jgi:catechol 2,3-dioxygenase
VRLAVSDLPRAERFHRDVIGLRPTVPAAGGDRRELALGDGETTVVTLVEEPGAQPARRGPGLYHVALLYPTRAELARAAMRIALSRTPIQGASDHGTHEAIYLADPDGNGLELAADRPRDRWPDVRSVDGYAGGPQPLDTDSLLAEVAGEAPTASAAPGLRVGHVHLHVGDVARGLAFYRDALGFDEMVDLGSAAFVSAGGYHHHVGFNVWRGRGDERVSDGVVGLRDWTIELPAAADVAAVRERLAAAGAEVCDHDCGFSATDPWGIPFTVRAF